MLRSLARNLLAGGRLALFLPLQAHQYRVSAGDYAMLLAFNFLLWVAVAAVRVGFEGEFDASAIPLYLAGVPLVLGAAMVAAASFGAPGRLLGLAVALTASDWVFELAGLALPALAAAAGAPGVAFFVFLAWIWLVALRALAVVAGTRRPAFLQAGLAITGMIAVGFFLFPRTDVWVPPAGEAEGPPPLADERVFHLQGRLIERALDAIQPGQRGRRETYFVGFAPDSSEEVFLKELRFAKRLLEERFGARGRSIALASSASALEELPIGSATNLSRALVRVGETMNPDEDVLFLFLTAHGERDHRLSADQPPLELAPLTPTALARMLQESGIKWRVIVVSACYSGGYIEPLRDDNTIVIAAAAPDRVSFGCEPGRDFTYFGQAFFRDALARTRSVTRAFELARDIVGKQEAEEGLTPSLPQMWAGPAIAALLERGGLDEAADQPDRK